MNHTDGARGNELQQLRARLADLESYVQALPSRFRSQRSDAKYRHVTKAAHGFVVGTVIRHDGTEWVKAQANTSDNAMVGGIVVAVPHSGAFVLAFPGSYASGLTVTAGINYLSAATAGEMVTTPPAISVPVLMADSETSGIIMGGAAGSSGYKNVSQNSHGMSVGNVIRHNGTSWVKAQSDTPANAHAQGIVISVADSDNFTYALPGSFCAGLSGLTTGLNFVDASTAGALTATGPTHLRPTFYALSASTGILLPDGPVFSVSTSDPGSTAANDGDLWFKYAP